MSADPVDADVLAGLARNAPLTRPRPGHADLVGMQKYGFDDARPVLERASARETAARVALGAVARAFLAPGRSAPRCSATSSRSARPARPTACVPGPGDIDAIDADPVRCLDPDGERRDGRRGRRRPQATATPSAASSRSSCTGCRRAWAATCTGTAGSTPGWPAR